MGGECLAQFGHVVRLVNRFVLIPGTVVLVIHIAHHINVLIVPWGGFTHYHGTKVGHINRASDIALFGFHIHFNRFDGAHIVTQSISHGIAVDDIETKHGKSQCRGYGMGPGDVFGKANGNPGGSYQTDTHHIYLTRQD